MTRTLKSTVVAAGASTALMLALTDGGRVAAQAMKPLLVRVVNTAAEPIPVVTTAERVVLTTLGASPSDVCPGSTREVLRILPDGSVVQAYTVPQGKMLVLTDLEAVVEQTAVQWSPGDLASVRGFFGSTVTTVIHARGPLTPEAVSARVVAVSTHLQAGGVIGANFPVCVSAAITSHSGFYTAGLAEARLHGYLVAE